MLLRFRVDNYRSLRDESTLSLVSPKLRGAVPREGGWEDNTLRVAGIYGPNGSGKSSLLKALHFATRAVLLSATTWGSRKWFPHDPFALDAESKTRPSTFEFDFVRDGTRFTYGFSADGAGVDSEWLYSYPNGRPRMLFERIRGEEVSFGRHLPGENARTARLLRPTVLYLSLAANMNHPLLSDVADSLTYSIAYARYGDQDRQARLRLTRRLLEIDPELQPKCEALLKFADLGISGLRLHEQEVRDDFKERIGRVLAAAAEGQDLDDVQVRVEDLVEDLSKEIRFSHSSGESQSAELRLEEESDGTVAWLGLAVPALSALEDGGILVVDEIDSSLHPRLTSAMISLFHDSELNTRNAQLIFSSHDTALMGNPLGDTLSPEETWFTEKRPDGSTELFALEEFTVRKKDNVEKRYLEGRYGAFPIVQIDELKAALAKSKN